MPRKLMRTNRIFIPATRMKHSSTAAARFSHTDGIREKLERRLGRLHARQRLGIELDHEAQVFGQGLNFFHTGNPFFSSILIEGVLRLSGLYWQGRRNAAKVRVRQDVIVSHPVPKTLAGVWILQLRRLQSR